MTARFSSKLENVPPRGKTRGHRPRPQFAIRCIPRLEHATLSPMLSGKRIAVVLPAYNAARTLERTVAEIPREVVDWILLVDDSSRDETIEVARRLNLQVFLHDRNFGYGRNQKTCYAEALRLNADVVVMLH